MDRTPAAGGLDLLLETRCGSLAFRVPGPGGGGLLLVSPAAALYAGEPLPGATLQAVRAAADRASKRSFWPARGLFAEDPDQTAGLRWVPSRQSGPEGEGGGDEGAGPIPPPVVAAAAAESFLRTLRLLGEQAAGDAGLRALSERALAAAARLTQLSKPAAPAGGPGWTTEYLCVAGEQGTARAAVLGRAGFSRGLWREVIRDGYLLRNGSPVHALDPVAPGDTIAVMLPPRPESNVVPEPGPLAVRFEDGYLLVIDKPAGVLVHPARAETSGTLANRVAAYLAGAGGDATPRPVGRLDRGTSGLIAFAKTRHAQQSLAAQHRSGAYRRTYLAITAAGQLPGEELRAPVVSPAHDPDRYPVPRDALTRVILLAAYAGGLLVQAQPATGRTHQIRQHLSGAGLPLWGDREYGGRAGPIERPALHAWRLAFAHPVGGAAMNVRSPLPEDMRRLLGQLRAGRSGN